MRNPVALMLIAFGGLIILSPVLAAAYTRAAGMQYIAEFYQRNSSGIALPEAMQSSGLGSYSWGCWLAGITMVYYGVQTAGTKT